MLLTSVTVLQLKTPSVLQIIFAHEYVIIVKVMVCFILLPMDDFEGNTSQGVRRDVGEPDQT